MSSTVAPPPATSTPVSPAPVIPQSRVRLTVADIAKFPRSLPSGDVRWELLDGEPIPMSPPGYVHCKIALKIGAQLLVQGEQRGLGEAGDEVAIILRRNPDRVVGADAVFVAKASLPARLSSEGYLETIPELV